MKRVDLTNAMSPRPRRDPVDRHASAGLWVASVAAVLAPAVTFNELGDVAVICAIHPRMKMTVTITE
jgi:plastocyanin